jgi:peptidoglycan/LPS O-acetylase OafA/YrhL
MRNDAGWRRWPLFVLSLLGIFVAAGIAGALASHLLGLWSTPVAGFCAAFAVVWGAWRLAPSHKLKATLFVLVLGAVLAWVVLEPSWYPESYADLAYQPTHLPLAATYAGALLGCLFGFIRHRRTVRKSVN